MKYILLFIVLLAGYVLHGQQVKLAKPDKVQYFWHEQERLMFIHFGMATWQGVEYDKGNFDLKRINPVNLNTDDWCRVARSWGAKGIIFVAKHVGGFCWWPTTTTEYCVRKIPWKNGKGDLMADISASCRKAGLSLGVYCYPGDVQWGADIGSGGKTKDPEKQEAYNRVYRQQMTELLSNYGEIREVWFDGSCIIDVKDILKKYAKNAVIFQGPQASLRWPGTESGKLYYPAWNTCKKSDLATGISTQYNDDPDGDAWAPLESDLPLYSHNWFWSPKNEPKRKSLDELMDIYYKSVGYGGLMLMNSSPDTNGVIPAGDVKVYSELGKEINKRFSTPVQAVKNHKGNLVELKLSQPSEINHVVIMEDYRQGHRIRKYVVEGFDGREWKLLSEGSSVGRKKIDAFATIRVSNVRLRITRNVNKPLIRSFEVFRVDNFQFNPTSLTSQGWKECGKWDTKTFIGGKGELSFDLSPYITRPGQYEVTFSFDVNITGMRINKAEIIFDNGTTLQEYLTRKEGTNTFYINRTSQVDTGSSSVLKVSMTSNNKVFQNKGTVYIRERSEK